MAGLIAQGQAYKALTDRGLAQMARDEQEREMTNQQIKSAQKQQGISNVMGGAGLGYMIGQGAAVGGPWGAAIGAGIGLLGSLLG